MKLEDVKAAYTAGKPVPARFAGPAIAKDKELFFAYLMDNNPAAVNNVLRLKLGHNHLDFAPNRRQMGALINSMIAKNDLASLQKLIDGFLQYGFDNNANNYTADKELRAEILKNL